MFYRRRGDAMDDLSPSAFEHHCAPGQGFSYLKRRLPNIQRSCFEEFSQGRSQGRGGMGVRPVLEDLGPPRAENPRVATPTVLRICKQLEFGMEYQPNL